jgi:hypothetical protein
MHNGPSTSSCRSCSKTIARAQYNREELTAVGAYASASPGRPADRESSIRALLPTCLPSLDERRERGKYLNIEWSAAPPLSDCSICELCSGVN